MALNVHRPPARALLKPQLSALGKTLIVVAAVAVLVFAGMAVSSGMRAASLSEKARPLQEAIDLTILKYQQAMKAQNSADIEAEMRATISEIEGADDVLKKADIAQEAINRALILCKGDQSLTDELNGCRNRIELARRDYLAR